MMKELHIKIKISDREYQLKIDPKEEAVLRQAGKVVNDKLRFRKEKTGVQHKQDLLGMVSFDCMVENLKLKQQQKEVEEKIAALDQLISAEIEDTFDQ